MSLDSSMKILCVDDCSSSLAPLRLFLIWEGFQVTVTTSPVEALALLASAGPYRVILSDFQMPQMDGVSFLQEAGRVCPDAVRILMSGNIDQSPIQQAFADGVCVRLLAKPWQTDELSSLLRELVPELGGKNKA